MVFPVEWGDTIFESIAISDILHHRANREHPNFAKILRSGSILLPGVTEAGKMPALQIYKNGMLPMGKVGKAGKMGQKLLPHLPLPSLLPLLPLS